MKLIKLFIILMHIYKFTKCRCFDINYSNLRIETVNSHKHIIHVLLFFRFLLIVGKKIRNLPHMQIIINILQKTLLSSFVRKEEHI